MNLKKKKKQGENTLSYNRQRDYVIETVGKMKKTLTITII